MIDTEKRLESAIAVLRQLEWSGDHGACPICRACRNCAKMDGVEFKGHRDECSLDAVLRATP